MKLVQKQMAMALRYGVRPGVERHVQMLKEKYGLQLNIKSGPWWAGGSILRMLWTGEFPDSKVDLDIFIPASMWKEEWDDKYEDPGYSGIRRGHVQGVMDMPPFQFIKTNTTKLEDLLSTFDIIACRMALDGQMVCGADEAWYDIQEGNLVVDPDAENHKTWSRIKKFKQLGMKEKLYGAQPMFNAPIDPNEQRRLRSFYVKDTPVVTNNDRNDDIPF